ncbi:hypothetical protein V1512DRAFT_221224 [Lipomyces arxii]|uniref:uncharacterized protein n=1 Tax=Lipomyces arxii TaxID=56418 RepID=UPI0034CF01EC
MLSATADESRPSASEASLELGPPPGLRKPTAKNDENGSKNNGEKGGGSKRNNRSKKVTKFLEGDQGPVNRLKKAADSKTTGNAEDSLESTEPAEAGETAEVCFICAEPIKYSAVSPCNHRSCHVCALRMRALYKTNACVHCRTIQAKIIFTIDNAKRYEDYSKKDIVGSDTKLGIDFDQKEIMEDTKKLQQFNCPDKKCTVVCSGWGDLRRHVTEVHKKYLCQLCTHNKKVFTHEHKLYTQKGLLKHERVGDDEGFTGHPDCQFCKTRFYSIDELRVHYRERHERCHICDQHVTGNSEPQYFLNYDTLEQHFRDRHYLCLAASCLEKKFVVFENELDLKAHQVSEHPNIYGTNRLARTINAGTLHLSEPITGGRNRPETVTSRDNWNAATSTIQRHSLGSGAAVPRDQLALQRSFAVANGRSFGSQLSSDFGQTSNPPSHDRWEPLEVDNDDTDSAYGRGSSSTNSRREGREKSMIRNNTNSADVRAFRQQRLDERAANLLKRGSWKYETYKKANSEYIANNSSAKNLINIYLDLFDTDINELTILVHEFVELLDDRGKRTDVLGTWNEWKSRNADFPTLPSAGKLSNSTPVRPGEARRFKPPSVSSVWSGNSAASSSSSSTSRSSSRNSQQVSSLSQRMATAHLTIPMSIPKQASSPAQSTLSLPMAQSQSASTAYANAWIPSSNPAPSQQKITFASPSSRPSSAASSSSFASSGVSKAGLNNSLQNFPSLPTAARKKATAGAPTRTATASSSSGWVQSSSAAPTADEPESIATVKKGKKTIVLRLG